MDSNASQMAILRRLECRDSSYIPKEFPLVFDRASGSEVWDVEGKKYIDLCAGFGTLALGHNPECFHEIWQAFIAESPAPVVHGMGDVYPSRAKIDLLEQLLQSLPQHFGRVGLALSGSQAVEYAVKTAILATGGKGVICFSGAYHGLDLGALNFTERADFRKPFLSWLRPDQVYFCEFPQSGEHLMQELGRAQKDFSDKSMQIAAVLVEPVQGRAGVRAFGLDGLRQLREFSDQNAALLIYDEIFCGLGRCGFQSFSQFVPSDLSCFGKALGGGLPLSAVVGTEKAMNAWPENTGEALHTGTFFGHPLSCRLGAVTLRAIASQQLGPRSELLGKKALDFLKNKLGALEHVADIRGHGLMLAIEFREAGTGAKLMDSLRSQGIIALAAGPNGNSISLTPALNIDETLFWQALEIIAVTINSPSFSNPI